MIRIAIVSLIFLVGQLSIAQTLDFELFKFGDLSYYSSETEIRAFLGKPIKVYEPGYDCGFLSDAGEGDHYKTLDYGFIKFTGNKNEQFLIEFVHIENNTRATLYYGEHKLTSNLDIVHLAVIFGIPIKKELRESPNATILVFNAHGDDGVQLVLKYGKLSQIHYWSPC